MSNKNEISKEWSDFNGEYEKHMQDIKLKNGDVVMKCWPNAGMWHVCSGGKYKNKTIPSKDVTHVRLTHDENW